MVLYQTHPMPLKTDKLNKSNPTSEENVNQNKLIESAENLNNIFHAVVFIRLYASNKPTKKEG